MHSHAAIGHLALALHVEAQVSQTLQAQKHQGIYGTAQFLQEILAMFPHQGDGSLDSSSLHTCEKLDQKALRMNGIIHGQSKACCASLQMGVLFFEVGLEILQLQSVNL